MDIVKIIILIFILSAVFIQLFDLEKLFKKISGLSITNNILAVIFLSAVLILLASTLKLPFIINFALALFSFWAFIFGFTVNRSYIYTLALIFLGITPILLLLNLDKIAEMSAILTYLLLVLGVLKDIFYEKVFNN